MGRQLRPRKTQPNYYATLASLETDDEYEPSRAGPSSKPKSKAVYVDDGESESDFELPGGGENAANGQQNEEEDDEGEEDEEDEEDEIDEIDDEDEVVVEKKGGRTKSNASATLKPRKPTARWKGKESATSSSKTPAMKNTSSTPSIHHRHRAVPLYSPTGRVERLTARPKLFSPPSIALTNGYTANTKILDRVSKSWGLNVGAGPLWDLAEDRGWYKEAITTGSDTETEAKRRPNVYSAISVKEGWEILSKKDAAPYLPTGDTTTEEGNLEPPPPLSCYFGPIKSQTLQKMEMFDSFAMAKYLPESGAHVFNAGAPVWGLDWCPTHADDRQARSFKQYLAVGPFPSQAHSPDIGRKASRSSCVQVWSLAPSQEARKGKKTGPVKADHGVLICEMVICLDTGPAYELKWCPLPSHDLISDKNRPRKLGLLAGTFEDGSFSIFVVPDPSDVAPEDHDWSEPIFVKLPDPILRIDMEDSCCWTFDWGNSEVVAIGTTSGTVAVYDIAAALKNIKPNQPTVTDILPLYFRTAHQSAIRVLAWVKAPPTWPDGSPRVDEDPTVIASAGYDGVECLSDIRGCYYPALNRTRDAIHALVCSPFAGGPITMDHEYTIKAYSASPSMLKRGHTLFEPQGPVWSIHASDYHPQLVGGSADGSCSTTNMLRSTRRGGSVPFFVHKIFQMDFNRNTNEYRMLDRFLPSETIDRTTHARTAKQTKSGSIPAVGTGAWPRQVGVHRVVWNNGNGLASSALLASGTSSGLCRIDVVWGRWLKDKVPYQGLEGIRMEDGDMAMDVDFDSSDGSE